MTLVHHLFAKRVDQYPRFLSTSLQYTELSDNLPSLINYFNSGNSPDDSRYSISELLEETGKWHCYVNVPCEHPANGCLTNITLYKLGLNSQRNGSLILASLDLPRMAPLGITRLCYMLNGSRKSCNQSWTTLSRVLMGDGSGAQTITTAITCIWTQYLSLSVSQKHHYPYVLISPLCIRSLHGSKLLLQIRISSNWHYTYA